MMRKPLSLLASLELTLIGISALGLGTLYAYLTTADYTYALALPLLVLALNLLAAIVDNPKFRQQVPLLIFHIALLAIILLVAWGRMTYMIGRSELAVGEWYDGDVMDVVSGPWHRSKLEQVRFLNQNNEVRYLNGIYAGSRNTVGIIGKNGLLQTITIATQKPLVIEGYRFYPSQHHGLVADFIWQGVNGDTEIAAVHLPSYGYNAIRQNMELTANDGAERFWVQLEEDETLIRKQGETLFTPPDLPRVVLRQNDERWVMRPGERLRTADGTLLFSGMREWSGYVIHYDPARTALLAAAIMAVLALAAHFWKKYFSVPWLVEREDEKS